MIFRCGQQKIPTFLVRQKITGSTTASFENVVSKVIRNVGAFDRTKSGQAGGYKDENNEDQRRLPRSTE